MFVRRTTRAPAARCERDSGYLSSARSGSEVAVHGRDRCPCWSRGLRRSRSPAAVRKWAELNRGSDRFGQASLQRDWQFATARRSQIVVLMPKSTTCRW